MNEHERRCRQATYEIRIMRGNGVIDLNKIEQLLDPDGSFLLPETKEET